MDSKTYDLLLFVVLFAGVWQGVMPLVLTALGAGFRGLAFPVLLPQPWSWIVSVLVIAVALVLLAVIDRAKKRAYPREG
jgi:hypothetical protein